jgi:hypothetical protein
VPAVRSMPTRCMAYLVTHRICITETGMKTMLSRLTVLLALSSAAAPAAEPLDGTRPLSCIAATARDCLPAQSECKLMRPDKNQAPIIGIDFAKKEVRSPFRTALLHVTHTTITSEALVLQGTDLLFAWSALIKKNDGTLTIAITDREGAYVVFGSCKALK